MDPPQNEYVLIKCKGPKAIDSELAPAEAASPEYAATDIIATIARFFNKELGRRKRTLTAHSNKYMAPTEALEALII
jgi:hypothetical protein